MAPRGQQTYAVSLIGHGINLVHVSMLRSVTITKTSTLTPGDSMPLFKAVNEVNPKFSAILHNCYSNIRNCMSYLLNTFLQYYNIILMSFIHTSMFLLLESNIHKDPCECVDCR